jgi:hypothetical protein
MDFGKESFGDVFEMFLFNAIPTVSFTIAFVLAFSWVVFHKKDVYYRFTFRITGANGRMEFVESTWMIRLGTTVCLIYFVPREMVPVILSRRRITR